MVITVSGIVAVCWLPQTTSYILATHIPGYSIHGATHATVSTMIMFNSAINPIVYALVDQRFREKIKGMICCICQPANNRIRAIQRIEIVDRATEPTQKIGQSSKGRCLSHGKRANVDIDMATRETGINIDTHVGIDTGINIDIGIDTNIDHIPHGHRHRQT